MTWLIYFLPLPVLYFLRNRPLLKNLFEGLCENPRENILLGLLMFSLFFLGGERSEGVGLVDRARMLRILLMGAIVVLFWAPVLLGRPLRSPPLTVTLMAIFSVVAGLTALYSPSPMFTLWKAFEIFAHVTVAWAFVTRINEVESFLRVPAMLWLVFIYVGITLLLGVLFFPSQAFFSPIADNSGVVLSMTMRGIAPSVHPNSAGQVGAFLALIGIVLVLIEGGKFRIDGMAVFGAGGVIMVLAHARTSLIAFVFVIGLFFVAGNRSFRRPIVFLAVSVVVCAGLLSIGIIEDYLMRGQSHAQFVSMTGRVYTWERAWAAFIERPLEGYGFYVGVKHAIQYHTTDSTWFNILLGGGFLLLVPIGAAVLIAGTQATILLMKRETSADGMIAIGLFIMVAIRSVTASTIDSNHFNLIVFLLATLVLSSANKVRIKW